MATKSLAEIKAARGVTPERQERIDEIKRAMLLEHSLHALRERRGVTQTAIAEHLATSRPNVSRIERESDVRLSTLARYAEAVGGRLHVEVVFADETIDLVGEARD